MNRLHKSLLLLMLPLSFAFAQAPRGSISGIVVDQQFGDALPGVNVIIDKSLRGAATDVNGLYTIDNLEPGAYTLVATYIGYARMVVENVNVVPFKNTKIDFASLKFDLHPAVLGKPALGYV